VTSFSSSLFEGDYDESRSKRETGTPERAVYHRGRDQVRTTVALGCELPMIAS
jgi:hypothetical protein